MNKEDSKVAELLQQLEELKRKKAQKLLKLQKLGRRSGKLSFSGSHVENNSETPSNKQHSQENKATGEQVIRKKCTKCDSKLKRDQNCSFCSDSKLGTEKARISKITLPLHPSNSENHSKTQHTSEDSESILDCSDKTIHQNNTNTVLVSQISSCSAALKKSQNLQDQKNYETTHKDSFNEKEILSFIDRRQSSVSETISKSMDSLKLQTHTSSVHEVYNMRSIDPERECTFHEKESSDNSNEKKDELCISSCYETDTHQSFRDSSSKQRKRSSSISDKEDIYECEAKKMRVSDDFKLVGDEKNLFDESCVAIFEDLCSGNVTKPERDSVVEKPNYYSPEKSFPKGSCTKSNDLSSNISGLLSGSFTVHENDENFNAEGTSNPASGNGNVKTVETIAEAPNRDNFGSFEKNCTISPSMRLSSPFSDELTFPVACENAPDVTIKQFSTHESVDGGTSCDVFESKVEDTECGATHNFESNVMNEFKDVISDDEPKEKPPDPFECKRKVSCKVLDDALDSEVLEFTEDLVSEVHSEHDPQDMEENLTITLLDSPADVNFEDVKENSDKSDVKPPCEMSNNHVTENQSQNELDCDAQTADLELDSISLVAAETGEDTIPETTFLFKVPEVPKALSETINTELGVPDSEIFTIPETEMLGPLEKSINHDKDRTSVESKAKCDPPSQLRVTKSNFIGSEDTANIGESCVTHDPKFPDPFEDTDFLDDSFSESWAKIEQYDDFQDTLMVEDTLELGNYKNIPFLTDECSIEKSYEEIEIEDDSSSNIKFTYCLHSEVQEPVSDIKIALFNGCYYTFVKFTKCILVCRLEGRHWNKIFFHEVEETFELNETCFTKNDTFLVLVMLLKSDQGNCLQFVLFEKDTKIIKLMEQTHWLQNSYSGDTVLLCGLDSLKFSTALGGDFFEVFVHAFSCLEGNPRLLSASLGNSVEGLHTLCPIESLPNAMIGLSRSMLYVWHLLETRLVTSVCLQPEDVLPIEKCFWAIIENGLIYFLTLCGDLSSSYASQLFVANLATGFCQLASPYNVILATESKLLKKRNLSAAYSQPFLVASCSEGSFLWSIDDEYCSASLDNDISASAIAITSMKEDSYIIAIGTIEGTVNFYNLRCL